MLLGPNNGVFSTFDGQIFRGDAPSGDFEAVSLRPGAYSPDWPIIFKSILTSTRSLIVQVRTGRGLGPAGA